MSAKFPIVVRLLAVLIAPPSVIVDELLTPVPPCAAVAVPEMLLNAGCAFEITPPLEIAVRKLFDAPVSGITELELASGNVNVLAAAVTALVILLLFVAAPPT